MFLQKCFEAVAENIDEALIAIDKQGFLIVINKMAEYLLDISAEKYIGRHIEETMLKTNLLMILETGKDELNQNVFAKGRKFIVNEIAVITEGKVEGAIAIFRGISDSKKMQKELIADRLYINSLETIMNTLNECVVVVDKNSIITMMSKAYKEFLACSNPEGKFVKDLIENTRLDETVKTGIMEVGDIQDIKGNKMVAMRIPLKEDGKVIGAVGKIIFKDIRDLYTLSKKITNLQNEVKFYKSALGKEREAKYSIKDIIGECDKIKEVKSIAIRVANTISNVLIVGESGTGKELFAHAIHNASKRYLGPFVNINCAAIPPELLEAEFFGYEEGAFTGAKKGGKIGKFELANKGTIFLDEIGDMPIKMQVKLLRVIQEKEVERVGGNSLKKIDVRIIAATNKNLLDSVKEGSFREDLYYRLNVMNIVVPPLRERKEDIPILANSLRVKITNKLGVYAEGISKEALDCLVNYDWPGNIRELENVIERAVNLLDSDLVIKLDHLPKKIIKNKFKYHTSDGKYLKGIVEEVEKEIITEYLIKTNWNKNMTAKLLGISRAGLYKKIEAYKLENQTRI